MHLLICSIIKFQAKKFVEGAPKVVKEKATKEEAEKIKKQLETVGAVVELE